MHVTSHAALEVFRHDLLGFDDKTMTDYCAGQLHAEFFAKALSSAVLLTVQDMAAVHEAQAGSGTQNADRESGIEALTFADGGKGLVVRYQDGSEMLVAWRGDDRRSASGMQVSNVYLVPLRTPAPEALIDEMRLRLAKGTESYGDLSGLARELSGYARPVFEGSDPSLLPDIVSAIDADGVDEACRQISKAWVTVVTHTDNEMASARAVVRSHKTDFDLVERLAGTFRHGTHVAYDMSEHMSLVAEGSARDLYRSACAYAFERTIVGRLPELEETVAICDELWIGRGTVFAYNDTDVRVSAERSEDKDVLVHHNIDLNEGKVFVTVINRADGEPSSIDVYIAEPAGHGFLEANSLDPDESLDAAYFEYLIEEMERDLGLMSVDRLLEALADGRPMEGLAYSYDLAEKTLELTPLAYETGFLRYADAMYEHDLEVLRMVIDRGYEGLADHGGEFQISEVDDLGAYNVRHVDILEYLGNIGSRIPAA